MLLTLIFLRTKIEKLKTFNDLFNVQKSEGCFKIKTFLC